MKRSTIILLILNVVVWGFLIFNGRDLLWGAGQTNPNMGQISYYLYMPVAVLAFATVWPFLTLWLPTWVRNVMPVVALLFLPIYLFPYTGGM
jgi:surface polysaccharide O-acyltransferase-like enzyme